MEHIGAGLAALGVIGPGIGIGILAGMSAAAIGRNPDAAGQIRGLAIILAAFAEGLGVLAIVVGLLAIFIKSADGRRSTGGPAGRRRRLAARSRGLRRGGWRAAGLTDQPVLDPRRAAQLPGLLRHRLDARPQAGGGDAERAPGAHRAGPQDADAARRDREAAADQRQAVLAEARREANEIIVRAQQSPTRRTRAGCRRDPGRIERLREQAVAEIDAERLRALAEVRARSPTWPCWRPARSWARP